MNIIKKFFKELFETIAQAILGYMVGILSITLIMEALKQMFRIFIELGFIQFAGIASVLILIFGIIDYWQEWGIFIEISEFLIGGEDEQ